MIHLFKIINYNNYLYSFGEPNAHCYFLLIRQMFIKTILTKNFQPRILNYKREVILVYKFKF